MHHFGTADVKTTLEYILTQQETNLGALWAVCTSPYFFIVAYLLLFFKFLRY